MSSKKDHEFNDNLEKCFTIVLQSSAKGGVNAIDISKKLGWHKTTVYTYLNSLRYRGRVESEQGLWRAKSGEIATYPLEKEIVIELPLPKNKWADFARLQVHANYMESIGFPEVAEIDKTIIEKFNETRTIRIKGKNVDNLDLEKLGNLIQQANAKSYNFSLKGIMKRLKMPKQENTRSLDSKEKFE